MQMINNGHVTCIRTDEHASLKLYGVYRVLPDEVAAKHQLIRVVDESGEDYLYPASYFEASNIYVDTFVHMSERPEREFGLLA